MITELLFVERYHHTPIKIKDPENATVAVGGNVSFKCEFMSDLHPHVTWVYMSEANNTLNYNSTRVSICVSFFRKLLYQFVFTNNISIYLHGFS